MVRWHAIITYRTERGDVDVEHDISELGEIHDLVERGPHWDTVVLISIRRALPETAIPDLTVELAETL